MGNKQTFNVDPETFDQMLSRVLPSRDRLIIPDSYKDAQARAKASAIDLTPALDRKKGSRVTYTTIYVNAPYYGFAGSTGIAFLKTTRKGLRTHKTGAPRWFFGDSNTLSTAVSRARKRYGLKMPVKGWTKVKARHYNTTTTEEFINAFKSLS